MNFTIQLKEEIEKYIARVKAYKTNTDFEKIRRLLDEYADTIEKRIEDVQNKVEKYEKYISSCDKLKQYLSLRSNKLYFFAEKNSKNKKVVFPKELLDIQEKIEKITRTINESEETKALIALDSVKLVGKKDEEAIDCLISAYKKEIEGLRETVEHLINRPIKVSDFKKGGAEDFANYYNLLTDIEIDMIMPHEYQNLMSVISISFCFQGPFSAKCQGLLNHSGFSIVCCEEYDSLIADLEIECSEDMFEEINESDRIVYDSDGLYFAKHNENVAYDDKAVYDKIIFSIDFLQKILRLAKENPDVNLPEFAMILVREFGIGENKKGWLARLSEFNKLYEETPEQILIRDNRYYKEKELDAMQEAELNRQLEEANRERRAEQEAEKREREEERRHREQMEYQCQRDREEEQRREADRKREEREKMERKRRQEREDSERRQKEWKEKQDMRFLCWRCAHYGHGCNGMKLGCGNFKSK